MEVGEVHELVDAACGFDVGACDRDGLVASARASAGLRRWLDGLDLRIARAMAEIDACCEATLADATRTSPRDVAKVLDRATTTDAVPELSAALDIGDVSGGHVDVVGVVLRSCPPEVRQVLVDNGAWLARRAAVLSPAALRRELVAEVRELEGDGGVARLERQRRASRLRSWVDLEGMWRFDGRFDPETGLRLHNRLLATVQKLFAEQIPDDAPHDPVERQAFLRARAWVALVDQTTPGSRSGTGARTRNGTGTGSATGPPELIAVIDATAPDSGGRPAIDWGLPVELPHDVLLRCFDEGRVSCVVVRNGVVIHAPGCLDLGRTTRLANPAQRRVLRALYPTCAVPGCEARFDLCKIHHVVWWEHGGMTDLENLLPLCSRHHHDVHEGGWQLKLAPDRRLTITHPDGTTQSTGPPRRGGTSTGHR